MTNKILIDRGLLDEFRRYTEAGVPQQGSWGHDLLQKLRAALTAPQQEADGYIYEYESPFGGVHRELTCRQWNGQEPCRTIPYYLHPAPSVPEGWQLVPKEPTQEMMAAHDNLLMQGVPRGRNLIYRAMLSAAPKAPTTDDRKDAEIAKLVRMKLTSGNGIPVERCTIRASEIAAIDAAMAAQKGEKE